MIIVANCNSSHLTNSLTCLNYLKNKFNKTDNEKKRKHSHDRGTKYYIEKICH